MSLDLLRPCLVCGEPSTESRCPDHQRPEALRARGSREERGYDAAWRRLSRRARRLQPFCLDCGAVKPLTTDHLPIAHWRRLNGLAIRLIDVEVTCAACNNKRGPAIPGSRRYAEWEESRA